MESIGKTLAGKAVLTAQDLNEQNRRFWSIQSELLDKRMSDELLYTIATMDVCSETLRQVPIYSQKSLEQALADAEKIKSACQTAFSRKGGSTPRCDALQGLIEEIVREKMKITQGQLLRELKGARGAGTVIPDEKVDRVPDSGNWIHFVDEKGKPKQASTSGLKDRLSRAKRKIASH